MNLFNYSNCAREYMFWDTYLFQFSYNMISSENFFHYASYQKKTLPRKEKSVSPAIKSVLCQNIFFIMYLIKSPLLSSKN